ncbi:uncharacterized protein LOC132698563 [Cylas formicarius]|uniref:uncharacterized protein LOC132698563 n=1 Tax=Cylas formicarius TaxID=197179 RepID=UPI0029589B6A|nr:uncharacterized protein LOC132698563 [Cylas formicarius]
MGRKIPGKKHRGVKDPEKQKAERLTRIKDKINAPPSKPDDQEVSKSLSRIIELKNKVKKGLFNKVNKAHRDKKVTPKKFRGRPEKPIPEFIQNPGESDRAFKNRVNQVCQEIIREAAFEDKYKIDVKRNQHGEVEGIAKRPKDELEELVKNARKGKTGKKNQKRTNQDKGQKLSKSQKWAMKKTEKKKKKKLDLHENSGPQKEIIKFGEVAHAPPNLIVPKKAKNPEYLPRPGGKSLLLKSMLGKLEKTHHNNNKNESSYIKSVTIDKKGKRRDLPVSLRRQLDQQQNDIIKAYKMIKSKNRN